MTDDESAIFGSDDDSDSDSSGYSQDDQDWQGQPLFRNNDIGVAVWPRKDKNGNWYLSVNPPLIPSFNVFVNSGGHQGLEDVFNKMCERYNGK